MDGRIASASSPSSPTILFNFCNRFCTVSALCNVIVFLVLVLSALLVGPDWQSSVHGFFWSSSLQHTPDASSSAQSSDFSSLPWLQALWLFFSKSSQKSWSTLQLCLAPLDGSCSGDNIRLSIVTSSSAFISSSISINLPITSSLFFEWCFDDCTNDTKALWRIGMMKKDLIKASERRSCLACAKLGLSSLDVCSNGMSRPLFNPFTIVFCTEI